MKRPGTVCSCCNRELLVVINGVIVCDHCDNTANWPTVKRGET